MGRLKIYTRRHCPYCTRALNILKQQGVADYEEIPIDGREGQLRREIMDLTGGRWDVPQVFVDGKHVGDDDDLDELARSGGLAELLSEGA
jgi:glutaredoxin 3